MPKNMAYFGIIGPTGHDSVRNHTQMVPNTTKTRDIHVTETLPTIECRQFFGKFFYFLCETTFLAAFAKQLKFKYAGTLQVSDSEIESTVPSL